MREITHAEQCQAADYASELDATYIERDCGKTYAINRKTILSLGAHRTFEFLKDNGFKVTKEE